MRLTLFEDSLRIIPEAEQDFAYLRDVLGLKEDGDSIQLVLHCGTIMAFGYLETEKQENKEGA